MQSEQNQINNPETGGENHAKPRVLLLNGPNLTMLGRRDPEKYGTFTLDDVIESTRIKSAELGYSLISFQSNHEGELIDKIHEMMDSCAGILINAGALTHYSYALRDAIELCPVPVIEIHISDIENREDFRRNSVIRPVCSGQISGFGLNSYLMGMDYLEGILSTGSEEADEQE